MHSEHYRLPEETAQLINQTKEAGGRVIAVGTTSTRTLESVAAKYGEIRADEGYTDIFIYPGRPIRVLDGLIIQLSSARKHTDYAGQRLCRI